MYALVTVTPTVYQSFAGSRHSVVARRHPLVALGSIVLELTGIRSLRTIPLERMIQSNRYAVPAFHSYTFKYHFFFSLGDQWLQSSTQRCLKTRDVVKCNIQRDDTNINSTALACLEGPTYLLRRLTIWLGSFRAQLYRHTVRNGRRSSYADIRASRPRTLGLPPTATPGQQ